MTTPARTLSLISRLLWMLAAVLLTGEAAALELAGRGTAIDGDSIRLLERHVRLAGIDAPELDQQCWRDGELWPCGRAAKAALAQLLAGPGALRCQASGEDNYGRILATCYQGGTCVNEWLVAEGLALAYRRYSDAWVDTEEAARRTGTGLWAGSFLRPEDWRRGARLSAPITGDCPVKGNVNRRGDRIYHVRGWRDYARVRIRPGQGDRCFDSETAASRAGFRPAQR